MVGSPRDSRMACGAARRSPRTRVRSADLKTEFERRLSQQRTDGQIADPRESQIAKLKKHNAELKQRIARRDTALASLNEFKTRAISQLAAQHDEIDRLRTAATDHPLTSATSTAGAPHQRPR